MRWLANVLLGGFTHADRDEVLADLKELREHRRREHGRARAALWYWREMARFAWRLRSRSLDSVGRDLHYAARGLVRMPGVTLVALPTLALGIGATTALFSFADALMLRPLPVREPDKLVALYHRATNDPSYYGSFSYPDYLEVRDTKVGLSGVAAYDAIQVRLGDGLDVPQVEGAIVSADYFSVLGVRLLAGSGFVPSDDRAEGTGSVVVLSERLWTSRFGGDPSLVGRDVTLNGRPFTVVGIAPTSTPGPSAHDAPEVWVPLMAHAVVLPTFRTLVRGLDLFYNPGTQWLELIGRLDPGATHAHVAGALKTLALRQEAERSGADKGWTIVTAPLGSARTGSPGSSPVPRLTALLTAVVAIVLLIACANVANLLLVRATVRRNEMAVRVAMGAGRGRLIRQVLTEALMLALVGGVLGIVLAACALRALPTLGVTADLPGLDVRLDPRVLGFTLAVTLVSGLLAGAVPALRASGTDAARGGRANPSSGGASASRFGLHGALVAAQVALSLVLLVGAGLTLRTLWNLYTVPLGFEVADIRTAEVRPPDADSSADARQRLYLQLIANVRRIPGVRAASLADIPPFARARMANDIAWEVGEGTGSLGRLNVDLNVVEPDYFRTLGIPRVAGRTFTVDDDSDAAHVAVVNQALAERLWPGRNPLGMRIWFRDPWMPESRGNPMVVVGVVSDGRYYRAWRSADRPFLFVPFAQLPTRRMVLHVRGAADGIPAEAALRRAVASAEAGASLGPVTSVEEARAAAVAPQRVIAKLLALFGMLAGVVAVIGIYGVVSFTVSRRTREIGVRMALGARAGAVRRHVLAGSAVPILAGTAVGWLTALILSRYLASLLYEIGPRDPVTFAAVGLALVGVGLVASLVPARRATRVDPLRALQVE